MVRKVKIEVENQTIVRVLLISFGFLLALSALYSIRQALALIGISFFLALAFNPPVSYLASRIPGGSRALATGIAYVIIWGVVLAVLYSTIPPLVSSTRNLINDIPVRIEEFREASQGGFIADLIERFNIETEAQELAQNLTGSLGDVGGTVISGIGKITSVIIAFFTVLVLTFFMLVEGPQWLELFWSYHPEHRREHNKELAKKMYNVITSYVNGQLLIASIAGLTSLIVMLIVGVPNALALAGIVALTGLIPLIGASLGAIIVVFAALFKSVSAALIMLVFFIIYQQIENNTIQPYVQSKSLEISPLLVLIAVIIGINFGGLLGGFIAIPTAACLRIIIFDILEHRKSQAQKVN